LDLQYYTENILEGHFLIHCWKNIPTFSYREKEKGGLCPKIRNVDSGEVSLQRRDKQGMHFRSHIVHEEDKSHTKCSLDIPRHTMTWKKIAV